MKMKTPLMFAAVTPLIAIAGGNEMHKNKVTVDASKLQDTMAVTDLRGKDVLTRDGRDIGDVSDVMLSRDGGHVTLVVDRENGEGGDVAASREVRDGEEGYEQYQESFDDDAGDFGEVGGTDVAGGVDDGVAADNNANVATTDVATDGTTRIDWSKVTYDEQEDAIRLNGDVASISNQGTSNGVSGIEASTLIGMDVNVSDEESYGEIEDVLVDTQSGKAAAVVIDAGGLFNDKTYAVPVDLDSVETESEEMSLQQSSDDFEDAEEVDLDALTDAT